ncbi:MAG: hypothetical protein LBF95_05810 [Treponema sp.]|jgi:hypothetical protein|nr:hypothetical protein [Treponema sp.]
MARGIFHVESGGKRRLGFDTGLNAQAFAQAKLAQFITQEGHIVLPDGTVKPWLPGGVIESEGTMVVWGPDFEGERFDLLLSPGREDLALEALRYWLAACPLVAEAGLWPAGVFVVLGGGGPYPRGTMFFPPERLRCRCIQAESGDLWLDSGESLVFQDLAGKAALSFTAGAMLYRIFAQLKAGASERPAFHPSGRLPKEPENRRFLRSKAAKIHKSGRLLGQPVLERSGALPFPSRDPEKLHQDMREGVFLPLGLAAPGLDPGIAGLVDRAIAGLKGQQAPRPSPGEFIELLSAAGGTAGPTAAFFRELSAREREKLEEERAHYEKKRNLSVGTRRFLVRNTAIISGIAAALAVVILFTSSMVSSRRNLPTTVGMDSREVVETYYGAFATLDHTLMEACVIKKAGKGDIDMITRYFVTSRVRQAYEFSSVMVSAQDWFDAGAPPTTAQVLGVTDLNVTRIAGEEDDEQVRYRADYIIWLPGGDEDSGGIAAVPGPAPEPALPDAGFGTGGVVSVEDFIPPRGYPLIDDLTLIRHKGNWRISQIDRQEK